MNLDTVTVEISECDFEVEDLTNNPPIELTIHEPDTQVTITSSGNIIETIMLETDVVASLAT